MNLIIDMGNTRYKAYIFDQQVIKQRITFTASDIAPLTQLVNTHSAIEYAIVSSVANKAHEIGKWVEAQHIPVLYFDHQTPMPVTNAYKTPHSLGIDRLAAAVGAHQQAPAQNCLIIDMGTAITIDFLDWQGIFRGGNISPGANTRYKALNHFTKRLPLLNLQDTEQTMGNDTESAIRCGVQQGIQYELMGYIADYQYNYNSLTVFLTGGEAFFFAEKLKNTKFAPDLLAEGLNQVLTFNLRQT